jgi:hypothetical protein
MAVTIDGTSGINTPGVVNTAAETIATTLAVTGAATLSSTLAVTGVTTVQAGTAALPAIVSTTGTTDTGLWFPAADTMAVSTGGTERARIDSSGILGLGVTPSAWGGVYKAIQVGSTAVFGGNTSANRNYSSSNVYWNGSNYKYITTSQATQFEQSDGAYYWLQAASGTAGNNITFTQAMMLDTSGNLLVGATTANAVGTTIAAPDSGGIYLNTSTTGARNQIRFINPNGTVGSIQTSGSATSYNTSSDYRLKNTIVPMTEALAKVALLKPCTYKWKVDGSDGQGFIAHELDAVVPGCVSGEKDAVDADGNPVYQGIDTSFLVATLTAAIQEQQALITALTTRITALEAA